MQSADIIFGYNSVKYF